MRAYRGRGTVQYRSFLDEIDHATNTVKVFECLRKFATVFQYEHCAGFSNTNANAKLAKAKGVMNGVYDYELLGGTISHSVWMEYVRKCKEHDDALMRAVRYSPHPLCCSELKAHAGLSKRIRATEDMLARIDATDALIVPIQQKNARVDVVLFAGRAARPRPSARHLLALAATRALDRREEVEMFDEGRWPLTPRQLEIASWVAAGKSDWEIGQILNISQKTVNFHVENAKRKIGVRSRNQFVAALVSAGQLTPQK